MVVYAETDSLLDSFTSKKELWLFCQKSATSDKCLINAFRFQPEAKT